MIKKDILSLSKDLYIAYLISGVLCLVGFLSYFLITDQNIKPLAGNIATDFLVIIVTVLFIDRRIEIAKQKEYFPLANYLIKRNFSSLNIILSQQATSIIPTPNFVSLENEIVDVIFQDPKNSEDFNKIMIARKQQFLNITSTLTPLLTFSTSKTEEREKAFLIINTLLQQFYLKDIIKLHDDIRTEQISTIFPDVGLIFLHVNDYLNDIINIGNALQSRIKYSIKSFQESESQDQFFVSLCSPHEISTSSIFLRVIFEKLRMINELFINCDISTRIILLKAINYQE